jgi:hypothetical protein
MVTALGHTERLELSACTLIGTAGTPPLRPVAPGTRTRGIAERQLTLWPHCYFSYDNPLWVNLGVLVTAPATEDELPDTPRDGCSAAPQAGAATAAEELKAGCAR